MDKPLSYFDDVYIGPPVPPSVFYRGRRPPKHLGCTRSSDLARRAEAERLKNVEDQKQRQKLRGRQRRIKR